MKLNQVLYSFRNAQSSTQVETEIKSEIPNHVTSSPDTKILEEPGSNPDEVKLKTEPGKQVGKRVHNDLRTQRKKELEIKTKEEPAEKLKNEKDDSDDDEEVEKKVKKNKIRFQILIRFYRHQRDKKY